jgi:hypothetical protein
MMLDICLEWHISIMRRGGSRTGERPNPGLATTKKLKNF